MPKPAPANKLAAWNRATLSRCEAALAAASAALLMVRAGLAKAVALASQAPLATPVAAVAPMMRRE